MEHNSSSSSPTSMKNLNKRAEILSRQILRMPVTDDDGTSEVTGMSSEERDEQLMKMLNTVEAEISAYDEANLRAMETYFRKAWSKVPFFGKHAKRQLQQESVKEMEAKKDVNIDNSFMTQTVQDHQNVKFDEASDKNKSERILSKEKLNLASYNKPEHTDNFTSSTTSIDAAAASSKVFAGERFRTTRSRTSSGHLVERTSLCEADNWSTAANASDNANKCKGNSNNRRVINTRNVGFTSVNSKMNVDSKPAEFRTSWLFKQRHPNWVPLMQRWWIPWLCVGSIALIWTPDVWKLRVLYLCDYQYAQLRQSIHIAYWRLTMKPDEFAELMASIEAERPSSVKGTACPFEEESSS